MPTRAQQYRAKAQEFAVRARFAPDPETKRFYEKKEREWLDLAKRAEDGDNSS